MNIVIKTFILVTLYVLQISLGLQYNYNDIDWAILSANLIGELALFYNLKSIRNDFCSLFLFFSVICSIHIVAFFKLYEEKSSVEYANLSIFGNELLLIVVVSLLLWIFFIRRKNSSVSFVKSGRLVSNGVFYALVVFSYSVSLLCMSLGISRMGAESNVVLPFHLNGVLYMYRTVIVPYLLFLYVYNRVSNGKKIETHEYFLIFFYGILEVFVRLSKSALLNVFFPLFVFIVLSRGVKQVRAFYKYVIPVVVAFVFLYPIIGAMRYKGAVSGESFYNAYQDVQDDEESDNYAIYKRFFSAGKHYMDCSYLFDKNLTFDYSRLPTIMAEGGSAGYYTHVVRGYSRYAKHSSGTTGITDPYLIGGKALCFIVFILLPLMGVLIDRRIPQSALLYKVLAVQVFYQFVLFKNITTFIDALFLSFVATLIIQLYIIRVYSKKYILTKKK